MRAVVCVCVRVPVVGELCAGRRLWRHCPAVWRWAHTLAMGPHAVVLRGHGACGWLYYPYLSTSAHMPRVATPRLPVLAWQIASIPNEAGATLAVDDIIIEFEKDEEA